ncbi:hypothetical protein HDU93_007067, partial [Gonapodya sp. JEL0774]
MLTRSHQTSAVDGDPALSSAPSSVGNNRPYSIKTSRQTPPGGDPDQGDAQLFKS